MRFKIAFFDSYLLGDAVKKANVFLDKNKDKIFPISISIAKFPSRDACVILYKAKK